MGQAEAEEEIPEMTLAETFDRLDWDQIAAFREQKKEENLHLDFKTVANSELSSKDDKRNLARSISGFANSSGGIIIWGINARKNADGIDCATDIVELTKPPMMVSRLNALTGEATSPIVDGIRHKEIINPETGRGVVATLVPETDAGPYMAKLGEQRYYKRSGDSFYQMEHFDLEDMFGRRQKPKLEIIVEMGKVEDGIEQIIIKLNNTGRAVAKHAGFVMTFQNVEITVVSPSMQNVSEINPGRPTVQYLNSASVIHPNGMHVSAGEIHVRRQEVSKPITAYVILYCEGAPKIERTIEIGVR